MEGILSAEPPGHHVLPQVSGGNRDRDRTCLGSNSGSAAAYLCVLGQNTSLGLSKTRGITAPTCEVCRDYPIRLNDHVLRLVPGKAKCPLRASDGRCEDQRDSLSSHSASSVDKNGLIWRLCTEARWSQAGRADTALGKASWSRLHEASRTRLHTLLVRQSQSPKVLPFRKGVARGWGVRYIPPSIQTLAPE